MILQAAFYAHHQLHVFLMQSTAVHLLMLAQSLQGLPFDPVFPV